MLLIKEYSETVFSHIAMTICSIIAVIYLFAFGFFTYFDRVSSTGMAKSRETTEAHSKIDSTIQRNLEPF